MNNSNLKSSIYEVDGKEELCVWVDGHETEAMHFEVVDGHIKRKGEGDDSHKDTVIKVAGRLIPFKK